MRFLGWVLRNDADFEHTIVIVSDDGVLVMRPAGARWWAEEHGSFDAAAASATTRIMGIERSGFELSDPITVELSINRSDLINGPLDQGMMNQSFQSFMDAASTDVPGPPTRKTLKVYVEGKWINAGSLMVNGVKL